VTDERRYRIGDRPRLETGDGDLAITDDFPIVEYPRALADRLRAKQYPFRLPNPR